MEHFLGLLFVQFVDFFVRLDRTSRLRLRKVVSNLDQLIADPAGTLTAGPITIGPATPWGTIIFGSFLVTVLVYCSGQLGSLAYISDNPRPLPAGQAVLLSIVIVLIMVGVPAGCFILLRWLFRGGQMVLNADGVQMIDRDRNVFCPWSLFRDPGQVRKLKGNRVAVPVSPHAVPDVTERRGEYIVAQGLSIRTRQFAFASDHEAVLSGLYKADIRECAEMLLRLGYALGNSRPINARGNP